MGNTNPEIRVKKYMTTAITRNNISFISGGQTGVDRAALDFALSNEISCSGWCPHMREAEDGPIPIRYPLSESYSPDPHVRTEMNVLHSDGTLILIIEDMDKGTQQTFDLAHLHAKPVFVWRIGLNRNFDQFDNWLLKNKIETLNIAGPRESSQPGIYSEALNTLDQIFQDLIMFDGFH
jgi:hypothetical protein